MKLHILNDLHIEFADFMPPEVDADVVILAGDIGVGLKGLRWAEASFPDRPVIYVPGNHEFYHHDIALIEELKVESRDHVHVLNNDEIVMDGVRFLGAILWTDFALFGEGIQKYSMQVARQQMTDFSIIEHQGQRFAPEDALRLHNVSREWLDARLSEPFDGSTVVVTHHAPSAQSVHPRYAQDSLSPAFASNLEELMGGDKAALWMHGHTHDSFDYEVDGTRVICNPRGYAPFDLNAEFRADMVVEI